MYVKIYSLINFNQCDEVCKLLQDSSENKPSIDSSLYECIFKGPLKCDSPDDILDYFNDYSHPLFRNGSLVDADIIVTPVGAYGLVDYDFFEATFDESKVYRNPNMVRSVMIIPGLPAFETEFPVITKHWKISSVVTTPPSRLPMAPVWSSTMTTIPISSMIFLLQAIMAWSMAPAFLSNFKKAKLYPFLTMKSRDT